MFAKYMSPDVAATVVLWSEVPLYLAAPLHARTQDTSQALHLAAYGCIVYKSVCLQTREEPK